MRKEFCIIIPNDSFWVEGDDIWFVGRYENELYRGKLSTGSCEYVAPIPVNNANAFRGTPNCIKYNECIVCLPDRGTHILLYDLRQKIFSEIEIQNLNSVRLGMESIKLDGRILWAWSSELRRLIELDLAVGSIKGYYAVSEDMTDIFGDQGTVAEQSIYLASIKNKTLYEFNTETRKTTKYPLSGISEGVNTICYDGRFFWFSGFDECICKWNKETGELNCYKDFPLEFEVGGKGKKQLFYKSLCVNEYICFIPRNFPETVCNRVLFINKCNYQMKAIQLHSEGDDRTGFYTLEYVRNDRYVGIHYEHNSYISEIDTETFEIREKRLKFPIDNYTGMMRAKIGTGNILREKNGADLPAFLNL